MKNIENELTPFSLKKTIMLSVTILLAVILSVNIFSLEVQHQGETKETQIVEELNISKEEYGSNQIVQEKIDIEEKVEVQPEEKPEEKVQEEKKEQKTVARNTTASRGGYVARTGGVPENFVEVKEMKATAYCLCKKCCGKDEDHPEYGVTRSGLKIVPYTGMKVIAVDPKVIPLGTWVYVQGVNGAPDYGYAIAADTGSAIKNNIIDLYMDSHEETKNWGVKNVKVYIVE